MSQAMKIHHDLADVIVRPGEKVNRERLKNMIRATLDQYLIEDRVSAEAAHDAARRRHGEHYMTAGYCLRVYRQRADLTQAELARKSGLRQRHLSEMENNRRAIDKANAETLAGILDCDCRKFL